MPKGREKYLSKLTNKEKLQQAVQDILDDNISSYDVEKLSWYENSYRLRVWWFRIVFLKTKNSIEILEIKSRWDVYKRI